MYKEKAVETMSWLNTYSPRTEIQAPMGNRIRRANKQIQNQSFLLQAGPNANIGEGTEFCVRLFDRTDIGRKHGLIYRRWQDGD